jgi:predicted Zn-dependent protease with MMP-like domain
MSEKIVHVFSYRGFRTWQCKYCGEMKSRYAFGPPVSVSVCDDCLDFACSFDIPEGWKARLIELVDRPASAFAWTEQTKDGATVDEDEFERIVAEQWERMPADARRGVFVYVQRESSGAMLRACGYDPKKGQLLACFIGSTQSVCVFAGPVIRANVRVAIEGHVYDILVHELAHRFGMSHAEMDRQLDAAGGA